MSALGFTFSADDAHLAFATLCDEMEKDLEQTQDTGEWNRLYSNMTDRVRNQLLPILRLGGVTKINGDCDLGDDAIAGRLIEESRKYLADPQAYHERIIAASPAPIAAHVDALQTVPESTNAEQQGISAPTPQSATPAQQISAQAPMAVPAPAPLAVPAAKLTFIDMPAREKFRGITDDYHSLQVPMMHWTTPKPYIKPHNPNFIFNGYHLKIMVSAIRRQKNVLAYGPPGCGKTEFFKQFGSIVGLPVHKIPFDGSLSRAEIIGSFRQVATENGPETPFVLGKIPKLIQQPGIIILDEIDQADPDIQYMLHSVYEGEGLTIAEDGGRYIPRHENCYIVATANTQGRGSEDGLTTARYEMSEATRDRFPYWLEFDYLPNELEIETLSASTGISEDNAKIVVQIATSIRDAFKTGTISQPCSLRQLEYVGELIDDFAERDNAVAIALAINTVIIGRANKDDAEAIRGYVMTSSGCDLNTLSY